MKDSKLDIQQINGVRGEGKPINPENCFIPAVDIFENDKEVTVITEMPGISRDEVDISLEDNVLLITGKVSASAPKNARILLNEYQTGHYMRRFNITKSIDQDNIQAKMLNGLLWITLPKATPTKPRKIEISVE